MVLALIANISLSALVFAVVITMLVRGIHTPVRQTALVDGRAHRPGRAADRVHAHARTPRRLDGGRSIDAMTPRPARP